jgi:hypothetical protein
MKRRSLVLGFVFLISFVFASAYAGQSLPQNDSQSIKLLLSQLSDPSKRPSALLDPMLQPASASKSLEAFQGRYEISAVPTSEITITDSDKATVPVRVHYRSDRGDSTDANSVASFVRRNGVWYFADFDFVHWNAFPIVVSLLFGLTGTGYVIMVLFVRYRMRRSGIKGLPILKSWIPFLWPSILSETKAK